MPMMAVRSHFSLGESTLEPETIKAAAVRVGEPRVIVCDSMTVSAMIQCSKLADASFAPRFAVNLQIFDDLTIREKKTKQVSCWLKVYPHDWRAMQAIFRTLTKAYDAEHFFNGPRLGWEDVRPMLSCAKFSVSTGDFNGVLEHPDCRAIIGELKALVGDDNVYVEITPVPTGYHDRVNRIAASYWLSGTKVLLTCPILYEGKNHDKWLTNMAIAKRSTMKRPTMMRQPAHKDYTAKEHHDYYEQMHAAAVRLQKILPGAGSGTMWGEAWNSQAELYDKMSYAWKKEPISLPSLAADPDTRMKELCVAGLKQRMATPVFGHTIAAADLKSTYLPRLKYELETLKTMGFAPYFLLVDDLVRWCKANGIAVGPGRGSVGGSLVAYLMGITDIDPIRFGLLFERFINPSRKDLPDIDLDFMSSRRGEVIQYLIKRHGEDKVAGISNYGLLGSASAMKDVARVFGHDVNNLTASKFVPKEHGQPVDLETARKQVAEIAMWADSNPVVWDHAVSLQGVMRLLGKHAAGTIVAGVPITDRGVVEMRSGERTVNWDMRVAEDMGLVKLDILGLSTLDTIVKCLDYIKQQKKPVPNLLQIPLDCVKTLKGFAEGNTLGVFQMEGGAARRILKDMTKVNPLTFDDVVAVNALNRPGPIDAGLVKKYVDAKNGDAIHEVEHPNMAPALADTFNVIVYQEQVMRIAVDLCGYTLAQADGLRKAMGKKDKKLMAAERDRFTDGAEKHSGMDRDLARDVFDQIEVFAGYAFNKSHAAEYSLISYQAMWLKTHYPIEFYAASLSTVKEDKLKAVVIDALKAGISVLPPNINTSENDFVIGNETTLLAPFNRVKIVTEKSGTAIMAVRAEGRITSIADLQKRLTAKKLGRFCNKRAIENLNAVGAFAYVEPGQDPPTADTRIKDQLVLMPGLTTKIMKTSRLIQPDGDSHTKAVMVSIIKAIDAVDTEAVHSRPCYGKKAKFMVVADCPNWSEEAEKQFTAGKTFSIMSEVLYEAGLKRSDGYWTGLLKRPKADKLITADEIKTYAPFLHQEIDLLKPPLIITLGGSSARFFVPDLKGSINDHVGKAVFLPKLDATLLIGFNPAQIFHDPAKKEQLVAVFKGVREICSTYL